MQNNLAVLESYGDFVERFIDGYKSPSTKRNYKASILKFFNVKNTWEIKMHMLQEVTVTMARNYINNLIEEKRSYSDMNIKRSALSKLWENIQGEYLNKVISDNPWRNITIDQLINRKLSKPQQLHKVKMLTREQISEVLEYCKANNYRNYLIIRLILNTALRRSELKQINISEKDFSQVEVDGTLKWYLRVPGEDTKGKEDRVIYVSDDLVKELFEYGDWESLRVSGHWINEIVLSSFKAIGINGVTAHQLRHNKATWAIMDGASVVSTQKMLGHNSINTTMKYVHLVDLYKNNAGEKGVF